MSMQYLPVKIPSDAEVVAKEAARFRSLSPDEQIREINEMFHLYQFLRKASGNPALFDQLAEEETRLEREAIKAFVARHASPDFIVEHEPDPCLGS